MLPQPVTKSKLTSRNTHGLTVSTLNIAQVKRKCGIIGRECYNKAKAENVKQCPADKGKAIEEALRFFGMIFDAI